MQEIVFNIRKQTLFHCESDHTLEQVPGVVMESAPLETLETYLDIAPKQACVCWPCFEKGELELHDVYWSLSIPVTLWKFSHLPYTIKHFFPECEGVTASLKTSQSCCLYKKIKFQSNYLQAVLAY